MSRQHDVPPQALLLWHARTPVGGHVRELRCTAEQVGEDCIELQLHAGHEVLLSETFSGTEELLRKAHELRLALVRPSARRRGGHGGVEVRH
jgi:hypothetical protein